MEERRKRDSVRLWQWRSWNSTSARVTFLAGYWQVQCNRRRPSHEKLKLANFKALADACLYSQTRTDMRIALIPHFVKFSHKLREDRRERILVVWKWTHIWQSFTSEMRVEKLEETLATIETNSICPNSLLICLPTVAVSFSHADSSLPTLVWR